LCSWLHAPDEEDRLACIKYVSHHVRVSRDGATYPTREANYEAATIPDGGDAVQRPCDSSPVVASKVAHCVGCSFQLFRAAFFSAKHLAIPLRTANLRAAPEVKHHLDELTAARVVADQRAQTRRQNLQQAVQVVAHRHRALVAAAVVGGAVERAGTSALANVPRDLLPESCASGSAVPSGTNNPQRRPWLGAARAPCAARR
jgi:hypothetical protein